MNTIENLKYKMCDILETMSRST